ncbi:MAG: hypothetical protein P8L68_19020 [Paracoccaceae bacterium]|nr:hypothetical protein [Paracoccaceae bacterium]MDG2260569.1 hypothetical protein [Paracoccaceae bacterium]
MAKTKFYERIKGPMDNYEDWYYWERKDDGSVMITHEWSHVTPRLKSNSGSNSYNFEEFMASSDVHSGAKSALQDASIEG